MFGWGKKEKAQYPMESKWDVLQGQHDGKPIFIRCNESASVLMNSDFRFRVGVAMPLHSPNEHGLPGSEEMAELNAIELELTSQLENGKDAIMVLAITTGGMREFIFYSRDSSNAAPAIGRAQQNITTHKLKIMLPQMPNGKSIGTLERLMFSFISQIML